MSAYKQGLRLGLAIGVAAFLMLAAIVFSAILDPAKADGWSGCYGGVGASYAASVTDTKYDWVHNEDAHPFFGADGLGAQGYGASVLGGCDLQMQRIVVGIWGDYTWDQNHDFTASLFGDELAKASLDTSWAVGGRAGYLFTKKAMGYVLAGYTEMSPSDLVLSGGEESVGLPNFTGWVVGAGAEFDIGSGFFLQGQYSYAMLDSARVQISDDECEEWLTLDPDVHRARVAVVYKFNWTPVQGTAFDPKPIK